MCYIHITSFFNLCTFLTYRFYRMMSVFPKLTPEGYRVFCYKTRPIVDKDMFDAKIFCRTTLFLIDLQLRLEAPHGSIVIFDQKFVTLYQQLAFSPTLTKNLFKCTIVSKWYFHLIFFLILVYIKFYEMLNISYTRVKLSNNNWDTQS